MIVSNGELYLWGISQMIWVNHFNGRVI